MQELIRLLLERAQRTEDRFTINGQQNSVTILAEEVVRLAYLATSSHMLRSAQETAINSTNRAVISANDVYLLHQTLQINGQEQTS